MSLTAFSIWHGFCIPRRKRLDPTTSILTNMHSPPVEGNFTDDSGHPVKPRVVDDYNAYMGFVDKADRMVNSYGIARRTWKWIKKLFFHLADMNILSAFLMRKSSGGKMTHKSFREVLVQNLIFLSHGENVTASGVSRGRPSPFASQLTRLEVKHSQHWPSKGKQRRCRLCSLKKQTRSTLYFCSKWDVGLCIANCFEKWHARGNVWVAGHSSVDCNCTRQLVSLYRRDRKHLLFKCCGFVKCNITHASGVKYAVSALKIHRNIMKYITQYNFWIYQKVSWVRFTAKHRHFIYKCRILFSFKQNMSQNLLTNKNRLCNMLVTNFMHV